MSLPVNEMRASLLQALSGAYDDERERDAVLLAVGDELFPVVLFLRNVGMLRKESAWKDYTPAQWQELLLGMISERARIFLEVKEWKASRGFGVEVGADSSEPIGYCTHCGGCCEIASGYPDFPEGAEVIPLRWRRIFGDGLGKGHRFCAFLWEVSGMSLCSIHPWRSKACRVFEQDECEFFMCDPDWLEHSDPRNVASVHAWLIGLIDGRELPPV